MTLPVDEFCTCETECKNSLRKSRENNYHGRDVELFLGLKLLVQHLMKGHSFSSRLGSTTCSQNNQERNGDNLNEEREEIVHESRYPIVS